MFKDHSIDWTSCAVPVIVCNNCQKLATERPQNLACPLCIEGYQTPETAPDLVGQKRKLGLIEKGGKDLVTGRKVVNQTSKTGTKRLKLGHQRRALSPKHGSWGHQIETGAQKPNSGTIKWKLGA